MFSGKFSRNQKFAYLKLTLAESLSLLFLPFIKQKLKKWRKMNLLLLLLRIIKIYSCEIKLNSDENY